MVSLTGEGTTIYGVIDTDDDELWQEKSQGSDRAALMYTLIGSCKLNAVEPESYLRHVQRGEYFAALVGRRGEGGSFRSLVDPSPGTGSWWPGS